MEEIINDEYILNYFYGNSGKVNRWKTSNIPEDIQDYLTNRYHDSQSIKETLFRIKNHIEIRPVCPICGNPVKFVGKVNRPYTIGCSPKCSNTWIQMQIKNNLMDKYGVTNVYQLDSVKEKIKQTNLEKYGVEYAGQIESAKEKSKQTCLQRYGVQYTLQAKEIREQIKQTCLTKYGVECSWQAEQTKQNIRRTCLERYGVEVASKSKEVKEKMLNTFIEHYGCHYFQSEEYKSRLSEFLSKRDFVAIKEKIENTCLERYGVKNVFSDPNTIEKIKKTNLERYGYECPMNSEEVKEKLRQTCLEKYGVDNAAKSKEIKEKAKQTCLEKYGVDNTAKLESSKEKTRQTCLKKYGYESNMKSPYYRKLFSEIMSTNTVQNKINRTKKERGTFNSSKPENELYDYIKNLFPNVVRSYRSEKYPFNCDFYLPDFDLYIEFNGSQYHHGHAYDSNNLNDIDELNRLSEKAKNSKRHQDGKKSMYDNIINTWTVRDVRKRNIAKENKINYKELWTLDEAKQFIDSLIK